MIENANLGKVDIVLCEDNADDAELTIRALTKNGLSSSLIHLRDGEELLHYVFCSGPYLSRNAGNQPRLIILDLKMPKVDGLEVIRKLKSDNRTNMIPVVLLSSSKEEKDIMASYALGVNSYIVKPVEFEGYVKAVSTLGLYWLILNQPYQL
ncbi:two-component system response regulator [Niastella yeongjuensis]|uniref:Two-component system response regulator n=1 Tax=Niastella yeongjuensis TaxID=354355 RepID=A0A1V9EEK1_9BACT|nr:response regulator [Niastella yeongjuensis]OQP44559.1 two-component system response regulator [Niastella yeongjuensis]SEO83463.1 two-component system, unclassified family, response regulator [Niastella yeongjuensis]